MPPFYSDDRVTVHHGDCLDVLRTLPGCSVDSVVTDPPYGLEFMGKEWDRPWAQHFTGINGGAPLPDRQLHVNPRCRTCGGYRRGSKRPCRCETPDWTDSHAAAVGRANRGFQAWCEEWAAECLRVLKPGGHMLAFGGTRTWHRLACAVEDAGFEIRDTVASLGGGDSAGLLWMHGQGFPKSLDVSRAIDKAAGVERKVVGTKLGLPGYSLTDGNGDHRTYGRGLGDTGSGEAEVAVTAPATEDAARWEGFGTALKPAFEPIVVARRPLAGTVAANVLAHGTGALNIAATRVGTGTDRTSGGAQGSMPQPMSWGEVTGRERPTGGRWPSNIVLTHGDCTDDGCAPGCPVAELDAQSGVSRSPGPYARSTKVENHIYGASNARPIQNGHGDSGAASRFFPVFRYQAKAPTRERPKVDGVAHPTCKPLTMIRWMARLITPPGGVILDPFAGSGTTAEAAILEGFRCITIEREAEYLPLILARIQRQEPPEAPRTVAEQMSLLDDPAA